MGLYRDWQGKLGKRDGQIVTISTAGEPGSEFEQARDTIRQWPGSRAQGELHPRRHARARDARLRRTRRRRRQRPEVGEGREPISGDHARDACARSASRRLGTAALEADGLQRRDAREQCGDHRGRMAGGADRQAASQRASRSGWASTSPSAGTPPRSSRTGSRARSFACSVRRPCSSRRGTSTSLPGRNRARCARSTTATRSRWWSWTPTRASTSRHGARGSSAPRSSSAGAPRPTLKSSTSVSWRRCARNGYTTPAAPALTHHVMNATTRMKPFGAVRFEESHASASREHAQQDTRVIDALSRRRWSTPRPMKKPQDDKPTWKLLAKWRDRWH